MVYKIINFCAMLTTFHVDHDTTAILKAVLKNKGGPYPKMLPLTGVEIEAGSSSRNRSATASPPAAAEKDDDVESNANGENDGENEDDMSDEDREEELVTFQPKAVSNVAGIEPLVPAVVHGAEVLVGDESHESSAAVAEVQGGEVGVGGKATESRRSSRVFPSPLLLKTSAVLLGTEGDGDNVGGSAVQSRRTSDSQVLSPPLTAGMQQTPSGDGRVGFYSVEGRRPSSLQVLSPLLSAGMQRKQSGGGTVGSHAAEGCRSSSSQVSSPELSGGTSRMQGGVGSDGNDFFGFGEDALNIHAVPQTKQLTENVDHDPFGEKWTNDALERLAARRSLEAKEKEEEVRRKRAANTNEEDSSQMISSKKQRSSPYIAYLWCNPENNILEVQYKTLDKYCILPGAAGATLEADYLPKIARKASPTFWLSTKYGRVCVALLHYTLKKMEIASFCGRLSSILASKAKPKGKSTSIRCVWFNSSSFLVVTWFVMQNS